MSSPGNIDRKETATPRPASVALTRARKALIFVAAAAILAGPLLATVRADQPEELYFSGRLIEVDPAKNAFVIRNKKKELVFTVDPHRCDITADGSISERSLKFARIGDAVMGGLSMKEARPYVTWVEFTRHAEVGKTVSGKPGYILSPYLPRWPQPGYHAEAMDSRQLKAGDMVLDDGTGKIFLVP